MASLRRCAPPALILVGVLAFPAAASAAVHVSLSGDTITAQDTGSAGNYVHVTRVADEVRITDPGITATGACDEEGGTVTCPAGGVARVTLLLGAGNDFVGQPSGGIRVEMHGEAGDDILSDGYGDDLLDGGADDDEFRMIGGDDEIVGGSGADDVLSYSGYDVGVDVTLPDTGITTGNGPEGEDDTVHADVEHVGGGGPGIDHLVGNEQSNSLSGDFVTGAGGDDDLSVDVGAADGGPGDDFIRAEDDYVQDALTCGTGDDRIDADNDLDPLPSGCETIAPEFLSQPRLFDNHPWVGGWVHVDVPDSSGTFPTDFWIEWVRCSDSICRPQTRGDVATYSFTEDDFYHGVYALVHVGNSAGLDEAQSAGTGRITRLRTPPPAPPDEPVALPAPGGGGYADYGDYADVLEQQLGPLDAVLGRTLRALARRWAGRDPRALARRASIGHRVTFPETGELTLTWTAPRPGPRAAAAKSLTLARGRATGSRGVARTVAVRLTKRGRALLRRSKRLRVTVSARFVGGAATAAAPAEAKRAFTLKRRRR